jgi:hypothetical protein
MINTDNILFNNIVIDYITFFFDFLWAYGDFCIEHRII